MKQRLDELNRSTAVPFAFRVYATYEVDSALSDKKLHSILDKLNPELRSTEEVDGKNIYTVNEGDLVACFADKVTDNVVRAMAEKQPLRVIFRDSCFDRDADKINIYETFKQLMDWSDQEVVKNIRVI